MRRVLTIAGSDTGGGAGIQADLKTIAALGGHGMSVITALTAQNSRGVQSVYPVPLPFIAAQMEAVFSDMGADAVKTGMLWDADTVRLVAEKLTQHRVEKLVVDPVMVAKDGSSLLDEGGRDALRQTLLPRALLVTPNLPEAASLAGMEVRTVEEMREAACRIRGFGAAAILVKGGHLEGEPVDILFDGSGFTELSAERIGVHEAHGTGCVLSAAIVTELAKGASLREAVERGRTLTRMGIEAAFAVGKGRLFIDPCVSRAKERERYEVIGALQEAIARLKGEEGIGGLIPEVSSNLGYALPSAHVSEDVASFPGRIIRLRDAITTVNTPEFGASQHIASVILAVMRHNSSFRSAMNIKFSPSILQACREAGLRILGFDREEEPREIREEEGRSLAWGVGKVVSEAGEVPDLIYDEGGWGKEPMIRVLGRDPGEVVRKVIEIHRIIKGRGPLR